MTTFKRVSVLNNDLLTSTEKTHVLQIVNSNDSRYFNQWLKINAKEYFIVKESENTFKVTTRKKVRSLFTEGKRNSDNNVMVKLS